MNKLLKVSLLLVAVSIIIALGYYFVPVSAKIPLLCAATTAAFVFCVGIGFFKIKGGEEYFVAAVASSAGLAFLHCISVNSFVVSLCIGFATGCVLLFIEHGQGR